MWRYLLEAFHEMHPTSINNMCFHGDIIGACLREVIRIYHECEDGIEKNCTENHHSASGLPSYDKR